jgi:hypothetical protein
MEKSVDCLFVRDCFDSFIRGHRKNSAAQYSKVRTVVQSSTNRTALAGASYVQWRVHYLGSSSILGVPGDKIYFKKYDAGHLVHFYYCTYSF